MALLAAQKRQDSSADAVLKLDPLVLAGAQAGTALPRSLRAQFGPEAHLAVTGDAGGGGRSSSWPRAPGARMRWRPPWSPRMRLAAESRLTGAAPGILSMFVDDLDRAEWRSLRETLELEGAARRFLTEPAARRVVAAACASRMEMFGWRRPMPRRMASCASATRRTRRASSAALAPAVTSSM